MAIFLDMLMGDFIIEGFIKAASLNKTAQEFDEESCKALSAYVAMIRALYLIHQQNHWDAQKYGDHLLFERIYNKSQEMADEAAERAIGLCGEVIFDGTESIIAQKFSPDEKNQSSLVQSSLAAERAFQGICKNTYELLKEKDMMTLGLDDMIMGHASQGEVHIYLLQQVAKGHE